MNPIDFPGRTHNLGKPPTMSEEQCGALPIKLDVTRGLMISCWELTDDEVVDILKTKKVYLTCFGTKHPPVAISTVMP